MNKDCMNTPPASTQNPNRRHVLALLERENGCQSVGPERARARELGVADGTQGELQAADRDSVSAHAQLG